MKYYLLDLERTIGFGVPTYWKQNRHGYTRDLEVAGLFSKEFAEKTVIVDIDKWTIAIPQDQIETIINQVFE